METDVKNGLGRSIVPVLLIFTLASAGYGWYSRQTVNRLQIDLDRALSAAETAQRTAEINATEAVRQSQRAMQSQKIAEEQRRLAEERLKDCLSGNKR